MVHENQIIDETRQLTHEATTLFIKDEVIHNVPPELYDMDQEFANTKKNKNLIVTISMLLFILISAAVAFFVTRYIEDQQSKIPISINAFEDVNLREIFDKAKQHEKDMQKTRRELDDLKVSRDARINELKRVAEQEMKQIEAESPANQGILIRSINAKLDESIAMEEEFWAGEINLTNQKIDEIQARIDAYDTRIIEKAKEQEQIINNQQERFNLELQSSIDYYEGKIEELKTLQKMELDDINRAHREIVKTINTKNDNAIKSLEAKYNPETTEELAFIDGFEVNTVTKTSYDWEGVNEVFFKENLIDKDALTALYEEITKAEDVFITMESIPYNNFPDSAIGYLGAKYNESVNSYETLIDNLTPVLVDKNSKIDNMSGELEQLGYFIKHYVKSHRVNGVVIDPRTDNIKIYMDSIYKVKEGTIGLVFRNDSDFIGTVKFNYNDGELIAVINQLADSKRRPQPFDMILLNLK